MLARAEQLPGLRQWESRVWSELSLEDYRALLAELALPATEAPAPRAGSGGGPEHPERASWAWLSGAAAQLKQNVRAVTKAVQETANLKDAGDTRDVLAGNGDGRGNPNSPGAALYSFGSGLKSREVRAKLARAASPAALLRSMSAGRLEKAPGLSSRPSFVPSARSSGWEQRLPGAGSTETHMRTANMDSA